MADVNNTLVGNAATASTVAAIDIGSNSLRMAIAEVLPDGRIEVLERLQRAVRLGQDTFRRGRLGGQSMRAALAILQDYRQLLRLYHVGRVRAVATSAVREAANADTFLDRVAMATGLHVEVIDPSEESRLTVSAVRQALENSPASASPAGKVPAGSSPTMELPAGSVPAGDREETLIADVGGGSTLLTVLEGGEIATSQSLRLGSIRLQEVLATSEDPPQRRAELYRYQIANVVSAVQGALPLERIESFVAAGGDARFAARQIGQSSELTELVTIELAAFDKLVERCQRYTAEELSKRHGIPFAEAETISPALLIYQTLLRKTKAEKIIVSHVSMRDGLLLELAGEVTGREDPALLAGVIHSATTLAEKYHANLEHARNVAELAVRLFDGLQGDHGLSPRHRLLLRVAGLLHEIGGYVSNRAHHKHSEYLIANSEIFGLNRNEIAIVAQIARYHRRSMPRPSHLAYMALPRELRVAVNKLAALLRVADAVTRGHVRKAKDVRIERAGDDLILRVPGGADLLLEQRSIAAKGDLFEDIFGLKVRLEQG
jgi:exopolyphosphatase / guanosine-5'-triphosphate,3'-diphosphate pyrophosphatase